MKCPNCGAEMQEGDLYCEHCGEDIHMVPDFEPELELNLEQSFERIREDVEGRDTTGQKDSGNGKKADRRTLRKWIHIVGWSAIVIFGIAAAVGGTRMFQYYSADYQADRAGKALAKEQYEKAIRYYNRAIELDKFNVSLKFDLAGVYFLTNRKTEYEELLNQIVSDPGTDSEQLESAYGKLIAIYREREDYQTINDMLLSCGNEAIMSAYQGYLAQEPQFSVPGGTYDDVEALKLIVTGKGAIYYTTDGSVPDEDSERYMTPILLEKGDYLIQAVFVNENGISSKVASAEYHINAEELEAPELNVDSGDYATPVFITVINEPEDIYYTTDGTEPTLDSQRYAEPIPMPLGVSTFRFARLEAGRSSRIVDKTFDLTLETDFSADQAVDRIVEYAVETGKILDASGCIDDTEAAYLYQYQYVVHIRDINDFYVISEIFRDAQGVSGKTGNYFAVNVYTGYFYKLQVENGIYSLTEL